MRITTRFILWLALAVACGAEPVTLGLTDDGVLVGWQRGPADAATAIGSATSLQPVDIDISLLAFPDDLGVSLRRWNGTTIEARSGAAIAADRYKALAPQRAKAFRAWKDAADMQSADPSSITTADVDALKKAYEEAKVRH